MTFRIQRLPLQQKQVRNFVFDEMAIRDSSHHRNAHQALKRGQSEEEHPENNGGIRKEGFSGALCLQVLYRKKL